MGGTFPVARPATDRIQIYKLRFQHRLTYAQIENLTGINHSTAHQWCRQIEQLMGEPEQRAAEEQVFTEAVEAVRWRLLASLADEERLGKASAKDAALALEKVDKISRLERGKSTDNKAILTKLITQNDSTLFSSN